MHSCILFRSFVNSSSSNTASKAALHPWKQLDVCLRTVFYIYKRYSETATISSKRSLRISFVYIEYSLTTNIQNVNLDHWKFWKPLYLDWRRCSLLVTHRISPSSDENIISVEISGQKHVASLNPMDFVIWSILETVVSAKSYSSVATLLASWSAVDEEVVRR